MSKMTEAQIRDSAEKRKIVIDTIHQMADVGERIDFLSVADRAGVSRIFLYRHEDINAMIQNLRLQNMTKEELRQEVVRLRLQIDNAIKVLSVRKEE